MPDSSDVRVARAPSGAPATGAAVSDVLSADETYQRLSATADEEFRRSVRQLLFSGLGAGLALGWVFLGRAAASAAVGTPDALTSNLLYPIGFVIVVLGRYQLYTENTLTPVTLVLTRLASIPSLLRLWAVVAAANLVGAVAIGLFIAVPGVLEQPIRDMGAQIAEHAFEIPIGGLLLRGVLAGALVGAVVWLTHAVREGTARVLIIYGLFLLIPVADLFHVITGSVEVVFGVLVGEGSWGQAAAFVAAVGLGNTIGGVVLVALLNFGQTRNRRVPVGRDAEHLSWREWLLGTDFEPALDAAVAPEVAHDDDGGRGGGVDGDGAPDGDRTSRSGSAV